MLPLLELTWELLNTSGAWRPLILTNKAVFSLSLFSLAFCGGSFYNFSSLIQLSPIISKASSHSSGRPFLLFRLLRIFFSLLMVSCDIKCSFWAQVILFLYSSSCLSITEPHAPAPPVSQPPILGSQHSLKYSLSTSDYEEADSTLLPLSSITCWKNLASVKKPQLDWHWKFLFQDRDWAKVCFIPSVVRQGCCWFWKLVAACEIQQQSCASWGWNPSVFYNHCSISFQLLPLLWLCSHFYSSPLNGNVKK